MTAFAQRFLYTEGGYHPTITRLMLPIRQHLKTATRLKAGPKAVLMEVCELHENGGKGCYASNDTLAKSLGISLATVVRTVAALVAGGLLTSRVVKAEANRRYLTPTAAVRACYASGTTQQQLLAASNLTIVKKEAVSEVTIVKTETDYSQIGEATIVKSESDYSQNASRVIGDKQDKQLTSTLSTIASLRAALAERELELIQVKNERDELAQQIAELTTAQPESSAPATPRRSEGRAAAPAAPGDFAAFWDAFDKKEDRYKCVLKWKGLSEADRAAALAHVPAYVRATPEKRYRKSPLTYLNGRCWLDEQLPDRSTTRTGTLTAITALGGLAQRAAKQTQNDFL